MDSIKDTDVHMQELILEINSKISETQEILFLSETLAVLDRIPDLFQDLHDLTEEIGHQTLAEIFLDMCEVISRIKSNYLVNGDSNQVQAAREAAYLASSIAFRQIINEETCEEEIDNLTELAQSIRFGDSIGFQVTDKAQLENSDDRIVLFENDALEEGVEFKEPEERNRPLRMLVVDDELPNRLLLKNTLKELGEIDVTVDGQEAVDAYLMRLMEGTPYDVIFMDIMMPVMDGHRAVEVIRTHEKKFGLAGNKEVIIFMVSCLDSPNHVCRAFFKEYCTDYIVKPIERDILFQKMQEYGLIGRHLHNAPPAPSSHNDSPS